MSFLIERDRRILNGDRKYTTRWCIVEWYSAGGGVGERAEH